MNLFTSVKKILPKAALFGVILIGVEVQSLEPKPFDENSLQAIEQAYDGQPFLLSVWSMACLPCHKELKLLSELGKEYTDFNLVLISTDGIKLADSTEAFLESLGLPNVNSWIYGREEQEKLRYSIDKDWYGEIPRSYFYDPQGQRQAVSGLLSEQLLRTWISANFGLNE